MHRTALAALLALSVPAAAQESASWLRTRTLGPALNPNVSASADFLGSSGKAADSEGFALREAEVALQAAVDPYARGDFFIAFPRDEQPELEEGYVTWLSAPAGFLVRGGRFLAGFGKLNIVHDHELPQADRPLTLSRFLGEEGLRSEGVEVSRVFGPFDTFVEASYALLNDLGEAEADDPVTTTVTDTLGNTVSVVVDQPSSEVPRDKARNMAHAGRLRLYRDLTDAASVELGASGASYEPEGADGTRLGGADLTFRWKPLEGGKYRSFLWRTEALWSRRRLRAESDPLTGTPTAPEETVGARGGYTYFDWQFARRWRAGVRADYAEDPSSRGAKDVVRAVSPVLTFNASEFQRLRLQYTARRTGGDTEHAGFLQWTVVLGPHGAHAF